MNSKGSQETTISAEKERKKGDKMNGKEIIIKAM